MYGYFRQQWSLFYRPMLLKIALVLSIFSIIRIFFYLLNRTIFPTFDASTLIKIELIGIRFDLSSILYINSLFILTCIVPTNLRLNRFYKAFQKWLFLCSNFLFIVVEIGEISFFPVQLRRMIYSDYHLIFNALDQWKSILPKNIHLIAFAVLLFYLFKKTYEKIEQKASGIIEKHSIIIAFFVQICLNFITIGLFIIGGRGGLQLRPITPISASEYVSDSRWIPLISNTTMNFFSSFQQIFIVEKHYLSEDEMKKYDTLWLHQPDNQSFSKKNVVVIAMESFGCDYTNTWNVGNGFTPFLDSLLNESLYCENSFANATRSAQGIVAITAGIPQMMDDALQFSPYQNNQINSIASLLREKGYYTAFFHASKPGSMMFDKLAKLANYEHFEDKTSYPNPSDDDGNWGIFDRPYFQYVVEKMDKMPQPFHTFTFSLTSHYPFVTEKYFKEKYPNMIDYQRSVMYSDDALRQFFQSAAKQSWFNNTLFVITADHTGPFPSAAYQTRLGKYRVPILFYAPDDSLKAKISNQTLQQIDILPSIMDFLHYDQPFFSLGKSIFKKENPYSINYIDGIYQVISPDFNLIFDGEKTIGLYQYHDDIFLTHDVSSKFPNEKTNMELYLKAAIQRHHQAMIRNGWRR